MTTIPCSSFIWMLIVADIFFYVNPYVTIHRILVKPPENREFAPESPYTRIGEDCYICHSILNFQTNYDDPKHKKALRSKVAGDYSF